MYYSNCTNDQPQLSVLSICKDSLKDFEYTLDSLLPISIYIELICVVRCQQNFFNDYLALLSNFPCFKISFNSDKSLYDAMNNCLMLKSASTPFLFLNSGDWLYSKSNSLLIQSASRIYPTNLICFESYSCATTPYSSNLTAVVSSSNFTLREPRSLFLKYIFRFLKFPCHQSILYGSAFSSLRFNIDSRISSDIFFNADAFRLSTSIFYIRSVLSIYNLEGISSTSSFSMRLSDRFKVLKSCPYYLFDSRILFGTSYLLLRFILNSLLSL